MKPVFLSEILSYFNLNCDFQEDFSVSGVNVIANASSNEISFWNEAEISSKVKESKAGILFVRKDFVGDFSKVKCLLFVENPYAAMVEFLKKFYLPFVESLPTYVSPLASVHPTAIIEGQVLDGAKVGPYSIVSSGSIVKENAVLEAHVTLYENVVIGENCILQAGVVIGSRGFGFYEDSGKRKAVPHIAGVRVGNNCSVGANSVIAAGFLSPTIIGNGTHLDSFVQIAHNCSVGNFVYMASQCALAGSTIVEDFVEMGGAAKASGHLTIGKGARVAAKAGVTKDVAPEIMVGGFPAEEIQAWRRGVALLRTLVKKRSSNG